jgi:hypothetical protein
MPYLVPIETIAFGRSQWSGWFSTAGPDIAGTGTGADPYVQEPTQLVYSS